MIDFHSHFYDNTWFPSPSMPVLGVLSRAWPLLTDIEAQLVAPDVRGLKTGNDEVCGGDTDFVAVEKPFELRAYEIGENDGECDRITDLH